LKLPKENIEQTLEDIGIGIEFMNSLPIAWEVRARTEMGS
jgi:hypothetical protein